MASSIERYKADLQKLILKGDQLILSIRIDTLPEFRAQVEKVRGAEAAAFIKSLPNFRDTYQSWYSEAQSVIRQLLPRREEDFVSHYQKPKNRKEINNGNYVIADFMQGITLQQNGKTIVDLSAAIPQFEQQVLILKALENRFESSLFEIKQLVQADLFDSEIDAAKELVRNKFCRAAGAVAGVVLEKHLKQVCENHNVVINKKNATISFLNDALKDANITDVSVWRFIQHLGDLRNLCDHGKGVDPTAEQVSDLINGVEKITKTLF